MVMAAIFELPAMLNGEQLTSSNSAHIVKHLILVLIMFPFIIQFRFSVCSQRKSIADGGGVENVYLATEVHYLFKD